MSKYTEAMDFYSVLMHEAKARLLAMDTTIEYGPHSKNVRCALACAADALSTDRQMLPIRNCFFFSILDVSPSPPPPTRRGMPLQLPGDLAAVTTWSIVSAGYAASAPMCERTSVFVVTKRS